MVPERTTIRFVNDFLEALALDNATVSEPDAKRTPIDFLLATESNIMDRLDHSISSSSSSLVAFSRSSPSSSSRIQLRV